MSQKTIADFISGYIDGHEGGLSMDPRDNGNWNGGHRGCGQLVGSKFGVTAGALATYRGVPPSSITAADIANLTEPEAVQVGVHIFYQAPHLNVLAWNRVTLSVIDFGWGSGPVTAVEHLQRLIGVPADGKIGPQTVNAYADWLAKFGEEQCAIKWAAVRIAYDTSLNQPEYINGWNNRTRSFLPGTPWWSAWA